MIYSSHSNLVGKLGEERPVENEKEEVKMADHEWKLSEDGCLNLNVNCSSLTYHPNLNVILVLTKCSEVLVIDVNSGVLLQRSFLSGKTRWLSTEAKLLKHK